MLLVVGQWFEDLTGTEQSIVIAVAVFLGGLVLGAIAATVIRRVLEAFGVDDAVEGTAFERTAQQLGTSTTRLLGQLCGLFIFGVATVFAAQTLGILFPEELLTAVAAYLPRLFLAVFVFILGLVLGDKAELVVGERLRSVKLPEVTLLPTLVKFSIIFVAILIALSQLGVATDALLILLGAYAFGVVFLGGLAFKDLLASAAAGIYLLLTEPYAIGDEIAVDGRRGIVQEVDVFSTYIENDGEEFMVPNRKVVREGAMRVRD